MQKKEKECPIDNPSHVKIGKQANRIKSVKVSYSDIDMNGHVNSMKYLEHALDIYSLDYWGKKALRRLEIAYIIEAYYGAPYICMKRSVCRPLSHQSDKE